MTLRVGIDVGGTFTDVVVLDAATQRILLQIKVPTTHDHPDGVAAGIVAGLQRALADPAVDPAAIAFVAHSTTQATNALLEGDVARVGVAGLLDRGSAAIARPQMRFAPIALAPNATFAAEFVFAPAGDEPGLRRAVDRLIAGGCEAIAVTAAFGVDRAGDEQRVADYARSRGTFATSGHDVASSYGLRARTRTAALNAAILPTMVRTARMTADATQRAGIGVPLMIMRSDGGVMDAGEVERRPILTMLSGPAAGIAGALLHENVTDGIFIEVGGTSSDLSVIRRGQPQMQPARVGGHRTMLRTLDVRTLGIAGGSLLRIAADGHGLGAIRGVGPRSAHIAGLRYACFTPPEAFEGATIGFVRPRPGDPDDCILLTTPAGERIGLTTTCAANLLGFVPDGAFARGDAAAARRAFALVGARLGVEPEALARTMLERAAIPLRAAIEELIRDYDLEREVVELVGGGGGAAALVPFVAGAMNLPHRLARDAEVIAPVGVALALVRDAVERTIPSPTPDDILRVRREAFERVVAAGADPGFVEVVIELEPRRNLVRAIASGATAAVAHDDAGVGGGEAGDAAARALRVAPTDTLARAAETGDLLIYVAQRRLNAPRRFPLLPRVTQTDACVVDRSGVVRALARRVQVATYTHATLADGLGRALEDATNFGDVGRALPDCTLVYGRRIANLAGLAEAAQVVALAGEELRGLAGATPVIVILAERAA